MSDVQIQLDRPDPHSYQEVRQYVVTPVEELGLTVDLAKSDWRERTEATDIDTDPPQSLQLTVKLAESANLDAFDIERIVGRWVRLSTPDRRRRVATLHRSDGRSFEMTSDEYR